VSKTSLPTPEATASATKREVTRVHLRGSNLLLFGRLVSLGINFLVNILTVRYLAKSDYGAFSYALAIGGAGANFLLLGMPRAVSRYTALFEERGEFGAMFGSLVLSTGVVVSLGVLGLALAIFFHAPLVDPFVSDPLALGLLLILIALAPLQALDNLFQAMLSVFATASAIFFRRYVLVPLLRLLAVASVLAYGGSVTFLAWAYLVASVLGVLAYLPMLRHSLARAGLLSHFQWRTLRLPWREVFGFGLGLVLAEILVSMRQPISLFLLESMRGTSDVADFSAFLKISGLNLVVLQSMKQLFLPVATRLLARNDHAGLDDLYWKTTIWIALMTFPIFVPCIAMPETMVNLIYGPRYVGSSAILVALAVGEYTNVALGLNNYTLQVYARVGFLFWTTALATIVSVALGYWLVPGLGAMGAAIAYSAALVLQNLLHHYGLHRYTEVVLLRRKYLGVYVSLLVATAVLMGIDRSLHPPLVLEGVLVAGASLALLRMHRETMDLAHVFPELEKLPWVMRLLGSRPA
jgi:O-antigen/teichoic acid export membrane protein